MRALGCFLAALLPACGGDGGSAAVNAAGAAVDAGAGVDAPAAGGAWRALAPLAGGARQETGVAALDGKVYVLGGFNSSGEVLDVVEAYDPGVDAWTSLAPLPIHLHHANVAALDGKLYVLGALTSITFTATPSGYVYDPAVDEWTPTTSMPAGSERGASAVGVIGGKIYVAGGFRAGAVADFSSFEPATGNWEVLPALPEARDHLVGGAVDGVLYVIGGRHADVTSIVGRVDAYDPGARAWSARAPMLTPRGGTAAAVLAGRIHVVGGEGNPDVGSGVFAEHEAYDPAADNWSTLPPMLTPRHGTGAAAVNGRLYVPGGATRQAFFAVATNEVFEP